MTITQALYLNVSDVCHSGFLYIVGELLELCATAKKVRMSYVKLIHLGWVKYHFLY